MLKRNWPHRIKIIFALLLFGGMAIANTPEQSFDKAGKLYKEQNYAAALSIYDSLLRIGYQSAELEFNCGNAYYRTGQIPQAILHYERAAKLDPDDTDIEHNLRIAYLSTIDKIDPAPELFYERWIRNLAYGGALSSKAGWTVTLIWLSAALFAGYLFASKLIIRKWAFAGFAATLFAGVLLWLLAENQNSHLNHNKGAIIFSDAVYVKASPNTDGANLFMLHAGTKVVVTDEMEGWKKIRIANGNEGWIDQGVAEEI
ncbi:MAG: SH3 domain-containing protein [Bacteroidota bacterium]|jgi:tetratricopeptide (TPR) repeat protein